MDLSFSKAELEFRKEIRSWLRENVPDEQLESFDTQVGFQQHRDWEKTLHAGNFGMVTWPKEYGGRGCSLIEWLIFEEEYYRAKAPLRVNQNGLFLLGPTLMEFGSKEQKERFLPKMALGEEIWAQGWSEPNAGSDMAAIRTKAIRKGEKYVVTGQKIWSTRAVWADWIFGMFRTDPKSERHHGLSFILVPLNSKGVTIRPIAQLNGLTGFAEVFFDEVEVPADCLLGEEGDGWKVAMATAGFERGLMLRSPARFQETARLLVDLYKENKQQADNDPSIREAVLRAYLDAESYCLLTYQTASRLVNGGHIGPESSTNKVFWSELDQSMHSTALSIIGARADLISGITGTDLTADWLEGWLFAQSGPIYAGTNEVQRNIISERMLGMPR